MEKLSGLILDVRDDEGAEVLNQIFPSGVPDLVKSAAAITPELERRLPDDLFALVLHDGDVTLRKYACIDAGNTALNVEFFMKTGHRLPDEAQKVAAQNLVTACRWYNLDAPEPLQKIALGLGTLLNLGITAPGMVGEAKRNLAATKGFGSTIVTPQQRNAMMGKAGEASGTSVMPYSVDVGKDKLPPKTVIKKVAACMGHLVHHGGKDVRPDDNLLDAVSGEQPKELPQAGALKPHVNVAGKEPVVRLTKKEAEFYALPSVRRYPLDSYDQVKEASAYFDEWSGQMSPHHRHEYCRNLLKRASVLRVPVSQAIKKYGSDHYAETPEIKVALDLRRNQLSDDLHRRMLDKVAEVRATIEPELFAAVLGEFDKIAGIDHMYDSSIPDPYASTFGEKVAESDSIIIGNDYMTVDQLKNFAKLEHSSIKYRFGEDFAQELRKDPVGIFNSLPTDQKKVLMRMATDNAGTDAEAAAI